MESTRRVAVDGKNCIKKSSHVVVVVALQRDTRVNMKVRRGGSLTTKFGDYDSASARWVLKTRFTCSVTQQKHGESTN